jgi:hypothetical protein
VAIPVFGLTKGIQYTFSVDWRMATAGGTGVQFASLNHSQMRVVEI